VAGDGDLFIACGVIDGTRVRRPLATQRSYSDMKLSADAGSGGRLVLNPTLTALAQKWLCWGGEGRGGEAMWWRWNVKNYMQTVVGKVKVIKLLRYVTSYFFE
jgi:hypothetical protein